MEFLWFALKGFAQGALAYIAQLTIKAVRRRMRRYEEKVLPLGSEKTQLKRSGRVVGRLPSGSLSDEGVQDLLQCFIDKYVEVENMELREVPITKSINVILELRVKIPAALCYDAIEQLVEKARSANQPAKPPEDGLKAVRLDSNLKR